MTIETALSFAANESLRDILKRVGALFMVTPSQILSEERLAHTAQARHVVAWVLRQRGFSYPEIGRMLLRDHSTIMASVRKVERERAGSPRLVTMLDAALIAQAKTP